MKNNKKFILAAGAAALGLVAATGVTSGFAWFTAANTVTVNGLNMKAAAEEGIVIANSDLGGDDHIWTTTASAKVSGEGAAFIPTSTANLSDWFHGLVDSAADGQTGEKVEAVTVKNGADAEHLSNGEIEGINWATSTQLTVGKRIFLMNKFFIQSAGAYTITNQDIYIKDLTVTAPQTPGSAELNKALRVGVKYSTNAAIFAPLTGATATYTVGHTDNEHLGTSVTAITTTATAQVVSGASALTIPAYTDGGTNALEFDVYVWFEGEDAACKSANITANLDQLSISFLFGNQEHPAPVEP